MGAAHDLQGRLGCAASRLEGIVRLTPQPAIERYRLVIKCENRQVTGSFKVRGAANALWARREEAGRRGVIAASAGNHGLGVAYAAWAMGVDAKVYVPASAARRKVDGIRRLGCRVMEVAGGYAAAEAAARRAAEACGAVWVSPYNDLDVIAGQGTAGLELAGEIRGLPGPVEVYVPVGGGGLIAGLAAPLRHAGVTARVIGVQPKPRPSCTRITPGSGARRSSSGRRSPTVWRATLKKVRSRWSWWMSWWTRCGA